MLTIAAVQVGDYLGRGEEYASNLFHAVKKHFPAARDARLVCLTDDWKSVPFSVEPVAVPEGIKGWWNKLALFKPGMFSPGDRILFFDLDTVLIGDISDLAAYDGPFAIMRDVYRVTGFQSSIMAWAAGACDHIWTRWDEAGRPSFHPGGDQSWIEMMMPQADIWQTRVPGQIVSFKRDCRSLGEPPENARAVVFHGVPRPHDPSLPRWVRDAWTGEEIPQ